ncbi:MAG: SNF2 helicase-associated domain-containing protein, partial [Janthinobacterium lividum]
MASTSCRPALTHYGWEDRAGVNEHRTTRRLNGVLVVHGLWTRAGTLALWVEATRRAPGAARTQDLAQLSALAPDAGHLASALHRGIARTLTISLPCTPAGRPASSTGRPRADLVLAPTGVEVVELRGDAVLDVLADVHVLAREVTSDGLRWLAHVAHGARTALDGGRVVPDVSPGAGAPDQHFAQWVPLPDRRFHRWRASVAQAAPPVLRAEVGARHEPPPDATALLDEVCGLVCDLLAARRIAGVPGPAHPHDGPTSPAVRGWLDSLRTGAPIPLDTAAVVSLTRRVREWQRSGENSGYDLVLRVVEPEPWEDLDDGLLAPGEQAGPGDVSWRLQARLRPLDDPSLTLTLEEARAEGGRTGGGENDGDPLLVLLTATARAGAVHPPLRTLLGGSSDAASTAGVELDIAQLLDLVEVGGPHLAAAGIAVQLPRHWSRKALSFSLSASAAQPGAITDPQLRKDDLVSFRWQAALGDTEVSEAELLALARSKSPLVAFRGEWVHVDLESLRRSAEFLRTRGNGRASVVDVLGAIGSARGIP